MRCGSGSLSPINLTPWLERDPFHKEADFSSSNLIEPEVGLFLSNDSPFSSTFRPPTAISNNIDFGEISTKPTNFFTPTTKKTKPSTLVINNNLDFTVQTPSSTTTRPRRKRTTTKRQPTIIDNKVDFSSPSISSTNRPFETIFNNFLKNSNTTKRSTSNDSRVKTDKVEHRSDTNLALTLTRQKQFRNEDNATKYEDNKAITVKFDNDTIQSRINHNFYSGAAVVHNNDFDNYDYRPMTNDYYPVYPPISIQTKRPTVYENNRPNFYDRLETTTRASPISNKLSGPFSYDTFTQKPNKINYDNMAIPLYISPNRQGANRPPFNNYPTTRKMDLTTFLIVQTTRRTTPSYFIEPVTKRPFYHSNFPSSIYISSSSSLNTNSNNFLNKYSFTNRPPLSHDLYDDNYDGYLRPENNDFYVPPYKGQHQNQQSHYSYHDYKKYNYKPDTSTLPGVKYYFIKNRLHKYQTMKSNEKEDKSDTDNDDEIVTKHYAEDFDEHLKDVTLTKTPNTEKLRPEDLQGRSKINIFADTQFVPFKLLTRPERPDNWINVNNTITDSDKRLPDVPTLTQDDNVARELPKPLFGSKNRKKHANDN